MQVGGNIEEFIQGITEEYKVASGGNVNAGDFVRFLTESKSGYTKNTQLYSGNYGSSVISAVTLSETKVFIAFNKTSAHGLFVALCTINGADIVVNATKGLGGTGQPRKSNISSSTKWKQSFYCSPS